MFNKPIYPLIYATGTGLYTNTEGLVRPSVLKERLWEVLTLEDKGNGYFKLGRISAKAPSTGRVWCACPFHKTQRLTSIDEDLFVCVKCNPTADLTSRKPLYKD